MAWHKCSCKHCGLCYLYKNGTDHIEYSKVKHNDHCSVCNRQFYGARIDQWIICVNSNDHWSFYSSTYDEQDIIDMIDWWFDYRFDTKSISLGSWVSSG